MTYVTKKIQKQKSAKGGYIKSHRLTRITSEKKAGNVGVYKHKTK